MAGMYAVYHGADGVKRIATRIHALATAFADAVKNAGLTVVHEQFFDTVLVKTDKANTIYQSALDKGFNLRKVDENHLAVAFSEVSDEKDFAILTEIFTGSSVQLGELKISLNDNLLRNDAILSHPVF